MLDTNTYNVLTLLLSPSSNDKNIAYPNWVRVHDPFLQNSSCNAIID